MPEHTRERNSTEMDAKFRGTERKILNHENTKTRSTTRTSKSLYVPTILKTEFSVTWFARTIPMKKLCLVSSCFRGSNLFLGFSLFRVQNLLGSNLGAISYNSGQ